MSVIAFNSESDTQILLAEDVPAFLQAFIVQRESFHHIFLENLCCPYTEIGRQNGIDTVPYGDYCIKSKKAKNIYKVLNINNLRTIAFDLSFISELCSLTKLQLSPDTLMDGDKLRWVKEPENSFDNKAVRVYKDDIFVGYIKKVHSKVFYKKNADGLKITIKSLNKNGQINRAFVKVSF